MLKLKYKVEKIKTNIDKPRRKKMAEKNKSFLDILNGYFSNIDESQVVAGSKEHIIIPMEWVFTEKIDRAVIERAFLNLICKANKS